ncbi:Signal peptidase complex catalytic subunit [Coelomomyces lativittatus]|nr:Signal peptidase complex catalytic subunit [Coelomomyces lativittatus]
MIIASALAVWKGLSVLTGTDAPIVVVLTESMEPAFARGDLLFLAKPNRPLVAGDIIVYKLSTKEIPIVHRLLNVHRSTSTNATYYLTKGDNNSADDRGIFAQEANGKLWLNDSEVMGIIYG